MNENIFHPYSITTQLFNGAARTMLINIVEVNLNLV